MRLDDLHVMMVEQVAGGVVELCNGQLIIDLGQDETLLRLGQLVLGIQNEKYGFDAQFVFALVSVKRVNREVPSDFCCLHREFGLLERVNGIGDFERDALVGAALLILVAAAADYGVGKVGLGGVAPYREV